MTDTDAGSVLAVSVAYNSFDVLPEMASSLPDKVRLAVVDNGPDDGIRAWTATNGHLLVAPAENVGFGPACNLGAAAADSDFILFINPDARLADGALDALLDAARTHPEAVAFGPEIQRADGTIFRYRPSTLLGRAVARQYPARPEYLCEVPTLNGACFLCRRKAFEQVGGFDTNIFLYFEDDDLSLRLAAQAGPLLYVPKAQVIHASGGSTPEGPQLSRFKGYHYSVSHAYILRKHGQHLPRLRALGSVLRRLVSVRMIKSSTYRNYAMGRLRGGLQAWRR